MNPPGGILPLGLCGVADVAGSSADTMTPGIPISSPVKGFTDGLNGLLSLLASGGCSSLSSKLDAILYVLAGVLGEALEDLESTELPQDEVSSLKMELVPPGGFKTLLPFLRSNASAGSICISLEMWHIPPGG